MVLLKCKMCGGDLEIEQGMTVCECEFCGSKQTIPRLDSDKKTNLYDRANHFRRNNDFDKAMGIYEQILNEDTTDAEAYWSLVLCRYGIEYVDDPVTHKKVPTINRAQKTAVVADEDYKAAIENADVSQKIIYEQEAKEIDEILKGILAISEKEEPFDVFICYKETDENGRRTPDSVLANDLYHQLTQEGFKVFFSKITLEDKLGQEYEPYIFAALDSAKAMVVLGTKPAYFNAVWVKNEWSRYLAKIRAGEKKTLIPAYKDMDPYDLPEEFSHLQAQDMTKLGFMQDLIRGIKKIIGADKPQTVTNENVVVQQGGGSGNTNALVKRGNMALEDGEWQKADEFFEEVLNQDAECAEAYLGKLMSKCKKSNISSLEQYYISKYESTETEKIEACPEAIERINEAINKYMILNYLLDIEIKRIYAFDRTYVSELSFRKQQKNQELADLDNEKLLARAKLYAIGETKSLIDKMIENITSVLDRRISDAEQADNESIESVTSSYKIHLDNADIKIKERYDIALQLQESDYNTRVALMKSATTKEDYENLMELFRKLHDYKDSASLVEKCKAEIGRLKDEERQESERQELIRKNQTERQTEKKKKTVMLVSSIVAVILIGLVVSKMVIIPKIEKNKKYSNAINHYEDKKYDICIDEFTQLGNYKDASGYIAKSKYEKAKSLFDEKKYDEAKEIFEELGNYSDSTELAKKCADNKNEELYNKAIDLMNQNDYMEAITYFAEIIDYKDSKEKKRECDSIVAEIKREEKHEKEKGEKLEKLKKFSAYDRDTMSYFEENYYSYKRLSDDEIKAMIVGEWYFKYGTVSGIADITINAQGEHIEHGSSRDWMHTWKVENGFYYIDSSQYEVRDIGDGYYLLYEEDYITPYIAIWKKQN